MPPRGKTVLAHKEEGNRLFARGDLPGAAQCFRDGVDLFVSERRADAAAIELFAKIAGNLCVCLYQMGDLDAAVAAAREVLATYPIIPKAYGVQGMCVVDRLLRQQRELAGPPDSSSAANTPAQVPEAVRADPARYCTTLDGARCSADDAHALLVRASVLAPELRASLGPHLEAALQLVTGEMLSAASAVERAERRRLCGDAAEEDAAGAAVTSLLEALAPAEERPGAVTLLSEPPAGGLATAPVLDAETGQPTGERVPVPPEAAAQARARHQQAAEEERSRVPTEFLFSGEPARVRVCHSERGGLPRGLTLLRVEEGVFAAANAVAAAPPEQDAAPAGITGAVQVDPAALGIDAGGAEGLEFLQAPPDFAAAGFPAPSPAGAGAATLTCVRCRKGIPAHAAGAYGCGVCGAAQCCSAACRDAYDERHRRFECELAQVLRAACGGLPPDDDQSAAAAATPGTVAEEEGTWRDAWVVRRVLPLCVACWGGLQARAPGWELLARQLQRPVSRGQLARLPPTAGAAIDDLAAACQLQPALPSPPGDGAYPELPALWRRLAVIARLLASPGEGGWDEGAALLFFPQRLLLRHSCEPNCAWSEVYRAIITTRFVFKGEELTMAADERFPMSWPWQIRQKWWAATHEVVCRCERCARESRSVNPARGELATTLIELLLTADRAARPAPTSATAAVAAAGTGKAKAGAADKDKTGSAAAAPPLDEEQRAKLQGYPTHFWHPVVQRAVAASRRPGVDAIAAAQRLQDALAEVERYVLPTHYLLLDLRVALAELAARHGQADTAAEEGRRALLALEAVWPGLTPAKVRVTGDIPAVFECSRSRRNIHRKKRNANKNKGAASVASPAAEAAETSSSALVVPSAAPASGADDGAVAPQAPVSSLLPQSGRDYSQGTAIDQFFGTYQSWYYL